MTKISSTVDPETGKEWNADALLKKVMELQDSLLRIHEQNALLSAQARDAVDLKVELNNQNQLLLDKSRENKHLHQELSRLSGLLELKLKEIEDLKSITTDLQHQLKTTQQERDLLADMLTKAENTVREATRVNTTPKAEGESSTTFMDILKSNTSWLRNLKGDK